MGEACAASHIKSILEFLFLHIFNSAHALGWMCHYAYFVENRYLMLPVKASEHEFSYYVCLGMGCAQCTKAWINATVECHEDNSIRHIIEEKKWLIVCSKNCALAHIYCKICICIFYFIHPENIQYKLHKMNFTTKWWVVFTNKTSCNCKCSSCRFFLCFLVQSCSFTHPLGIDLKVVDIPLSYYRRTLYQVSLALRLLMHAHKTRRKCKK